MVTTCAGRRNEFEVDGQPKGADFCRLLKIVVDSGYRGYVEVEFSGENMSEAEGIRTSKRLLENLRNELDEPQRR